MTSDDNSVQEELAPPGPYLTNPTVTYFEYRRVPNGVNTQRFYIQGINKHSRVMVSVVEVQKGGFDTPFIGLAAVLVCMVSPEPGMVRVLVNNTWEAPLDIRFTFMFQLQIGGGSSV